MIVIERLGGWVRVCNDVSELRDWQQESFWKKDFVKIYSSIVKFGGEIRPPERLLGICERDNRALGYEVQADIVYIEEVNPLPKLLNQTKEEKNVGIKTD